MGKKKASIKLNSNPVLIKQTNNTPGLNKSNESSFRKNKKVNQTKNIHLFTGCRWIRLKETIINLSLVLLIAIGLIFTIVLRTGEEFYEMNGKLKRNQNLTNYYEVLGVTKKSSNMEIRKAFRKLSLRWHPDKNPNCEPCLHKFRDISEAYKILGDAEKRKVYDTTHGGEIETIPSAAVTLTTENYDELVLLQTTSSWVIQVYTDHDELCRYFSSIWEESVDEMNKYYRFGRVHAEKENKLLKKLPINVKVYPAVFVITNGYPYEIYTKIYEPSSDSFIEFLSESFPNTMRILNSEKMILGWLRNNENTIKPKILITSNRQFPSILIRSLALKWKPIFEFSYYFGKENTKIFDGWGIDPNKPHVITFTQFNRDTELSPDIIIIPLWGNEEDEEINKNIKDKQVLELIRKFSSMPQRLEHSLFYLQQFYAPFVNTNNAKNLCESNGLNRIICLFILHEKYDFSNQGHIQKIIRLLDNSREAYRNTKKNLLNNDYMKEGELYFGEAEEFFIQPVQVALNSKVSGIPSMSKISGFMELLRNIKSPKLILIDLEGDRYSPIESLVLVYQKIHDEEINWERLPEVCTNYHKSNFYNNCLFNEAKKSSANKIFISTAIIIFLASAMFTFNHTLILKNRRE
ncbi:putative DnaJ protein [Cryptosporidium felis]|nr:putative DnaJ protein [Cryptosporidium felis]